MARQNRTVREGQLFSDSIHTKNKGLVRLTELKSDERLLIGSRWVTVGDIPLTAAFLECGHTVRGIALQEGDHIFCEIDHVLSTVASIA